MKVAEVLRGTDKTLFSIEVIPLKGVGIESIFKGIDPLMEFAPYLH